VLECSKAALLRLAKRGSGQWPLGWKGMQRCHAKTRTVSVFVLALADLVGLDQEGTKTVPLAQCNNLTTEGGCHQRSAESTVSTSCLTTEPTHKGASRDLAEATATLGRRLPFVIHCQRHFESLIDFTLPGKPFYALGFRVKAVNLGSTVWK
jgi:hypothetical protein